MAQAVMSMAACTADVPVAALTFPQSLAPGWAAGPAETGGHYRGAIIASLVVWLGGTALIVLVGYALQRWRPQVLAAVTDAGATPLARALTVARAPGSILTLTAFNLDPLVGSSAALAQVTDSAVVDAVLIAVAVLPPIAVLVFTARYIRTITTGAAARPMLEVEKESGDDARPMCYFDSAVVTCPDGTPRWLQMLCFGEGAWVPQDSGPLQRTRLVLASFAGTNDAVAASALSVGWSTRRPLGPVDPRYFFFATTAASCVTSVLRGPRFNCAAQLWLLAAVQGALLVVILRTRPFVVPAKTLLSAAMSALITLGMLLLAVDFSTRDADGSSSGSWLSKTAEGVALAATVLSVPKTALAVVKVLATVSAVYRGRRALGVDSRVPLRRDGRVDDTELLAVALLVANDALGYQGHVQRQSQLAELESLGVMSDGARGLVSVDGDLQILLSDDDLPIEGIVVDLAFADDAAPLHQQEESDVPAFDPAPAKTEGSTETQQAISPEAFTVALSGGAAANDDGLCVDRAAAVRRMLDDMDEGPTTADTDRAGGGGAATATAADIRSRLAALGLRRRDRHTHPQEEDAAPEPGVVGRTVAVDQLLF
jgi:hypothetical protein